CTVYSPPPPGVVATGAGDGAGAGRGGACTGGGATGAGVGPTTLPPASPTTGAATGAGAVVVLWKVGGSSSSVYSFSRRVPLPRRSISTTRKGSTMGWLEVSRTTLRPSRRRSVPSWMLLK